MKYATPLLVLLLAVSYCECFAQEEQAFDKARLEREFKTPPREFTLMPFWFWNDELNADTIREQIAEFEKHGVYGFTIHPRIGLPSDSGWMSPKLLAATRVALLEAKRRGMFVLLYDEGMYPSGSSAGQVVAENPEYAARGFLRVELTEDGAVKDAKVKIEDDWNYVGTYRNAVGTSFKIYDAPSRGVIRGLHYLGDESKNPREFSPPAADLLNPAAVATFIKLVYQRYYDEFKEFFDDGVVWGIFTDEPSILGRGPRRDMKQGNLRSLPTINKYLGYDFSPYLLNLWEDVDSNAPQLRADYDKAVKLALEEIYYGALSAWCRERNTSLCGHPESSSDVGVLRQFQIPGQDIVWRYIEPGEKAFDPVHSPLAKCASSAALHNGARRNLNEVFGAYGHDFTYEEMVWLINWCVVRGQNLFTPHAFYYSVRGPRLEERPPDVGPNSPWWDDYKTFADYCARLCWLNTDSKPIIPNAVLVNSDKATVWGTRTMFENQIDFNYLETRSLLENPVVKDNRVEVGLGSYRTLILTPGLALSDDAKKALEALAQNVRVIRWNEKSYDSPWATLARDDAEAIELLSDSATVDVIAGDCRGLRVRRVDKGAVAFYILFNEIKTPLEETLAFPADEEGEVRSWNPWSGEVKEIERDPKKPREFSVKLDGFELTIIGFEKEKQ